MKKELQNSDKVVESLQNLRDELWDRQDQSTIAREIFFKINSCLFGSYPIDGQIDSPVEEPKMKKVTLTWETSFNTDEEVQLFIEQVAQIHEVQYGTTVAKEELMCNGKYEGVTNHIEVKIL
jgi:hypothetical protein